MRGRNQHNSKNLRRPTQQTGNDLVERIFEKISNLEQESILEESPVPEDLLPKENEPSDKLRRRLMKQFNISLRPDRKVENPLAVELIELICLISEKKDSAHTPDQLYKLMQAIRGGISTLLEITKGTAEKATYISPYANLTDEELDQKIAELDSILGRSPEQLAMREES